MGVGLRTGKSAVVSQHLPERSGMYALKPLPHLPAFHGTSAPHYLCQALVETGPAFLGSTRADARASGGFHHRANQFFVLIEGAIQHAYLGNNLGFRSRKDGSGPLATRPPPGLKQAAPRWNIAVN